MFGLPEQLTKKVDKYCSSFWKIMKSSLKIKKEEILIVSDYGNGVNNLAAMLGYGYYCAAKSKGLNVRLLFQGVKKGFMYADNHVVEAITKLDEGNIVILALSNKFGRFGQEKSFRTFCRSKKHRFISATGLGDVAPSHFEAFMTAMNVNYTRMKKRGMAIKKKWDKAKKIRVTTELGTDITFNVEGKEAVANMGQYHEQGEGGNMPAGEIYIPPVGFHGVEGKVVVDGSMKTADGAILLKEPLTLHIIKGRVVKIEGKQAPLLERTFQLFEERAKFPRRVRYVGELAVGINPGSVLIGSMIMDEKVLGTGHIAIGSNAWFGGDIKTIFHGDQVFKNPTYYIDGVRMEF